MDPVLFFEVMAGTVVAIIGTIVACDKCITVKVLLAARRDINIARTEQMNLVEALRKQAAAIEEIKINTNNLMTESLKNKGIASHAEGVAEGKRLANAEYALMQTRATTAAAVLKGAAEEAARVLRVATEKARQAALKTQKTSPKAQDGNDPI